MASTHGYPNHGYLPTAAPPYVTALLSALLASLRNVAQALKNRRDATALAGMDERMLRDIGLTRSDLRDAYAEPLWRDPTDILAARVQDRRRSRPAGDSKAFFASQPLVPHDGFTVPDTNRPSRHIV
jgi:uncharacterized protein YjiS (DUF1127 family)